MVFDAITTRRGFAWGMGALASALPLRFATAQGSEKVRFGTNWVAQAEHGGFYQAVADGTYARLGLDVEIVPGGPQVNNRQMLSAGRIDFFMGGNLIQAFMAVEQKIPTIVVAAMFQKEPQVLIAHPGQGIERFEDLKTLPTLFIARSGVATYFQWMKAEFGFQDEQVKPYTFNAQPFLVDKRSAMQGYITSETFAIEKALGVPPQVFLLADYGFDSYATTIETRHDLLSAKPDLVRRFVEGSILGWYNYLYRDNGPANAMILRDNPDMTPDRIAFAIAQMKAHGIVDSGDTLRLGIGAMTPERVEGFYKRMVKAGVLKPGIDWKAAYDPRFVNHGLGLELRKAG